MARALLDLSLDQLSAEIASWGEAAYRGRQVWGWIFQRLAPGFAEMTDLPASLRGRLAREFAFSEASLATETVSEDRLTRKAALRLADGEIVETVLMRYRERNSVCISTQVGCPVGCSFCATGRGGLVRNLRASEIVEQVLWYARAMSRFERKVTHVVFMGMGEPLLNYDDAWRAIEMLTSADGFALGARHISISTAGVVPGIRRLAGTHSQVGLAVSLHAATDEVRSRLVPLNAKYPIRDLLAVCQEYIAETGRRVTFEYALIDRLNDSVADAYALASLLKGMNAHVNLIPLNATPGCGLSPSSRASTIAFRGALASRGIPCTERLGRGADIQAACGQLRARVGRPATQRHKATKARRRKGEAQG